MDSTLTLKEEEAYEFSKSKSFSYMTLSTTRTTVNVVDTKLACLQTKKSILSTKELFNKEIEIDQIIQLNESLAFDISDLVFGLTFLVLGFFEPLWFVAAAIFLYVGYGKKLTIHTKNDKIVIPYSAGESKQSNALKQALEKINKAIPSDAR